MEIYKFNNYRDFLNNKFEDKSLKKRKSDLAIYLNCQPGFISQALSNGKTHFSLEHIFKIGQFFELDEDDIQYLILLLQFEKAGSHDLRDYLEKQIKKTQQDHKEITSKIKKTDRKLSEEEKAIYYSHWAYMGIHMAVSLPELNSVKAIASHFKIDSVFTETVVTFLVKTNLIEKTNNKLSIGKTRVHLERTSPLVKSLHQNWRQKAIDSLINSDELNLHYSSILVLSDEDAGKIRTLILDLLKKKEEILIPSPEERMVVFNIDYFKI